MIDFSRYTREAIQKEMLDQVDPSIDTREGSMIQTAIGPAAWYLEGVYMILKQIQCLSGDGCWRFSGQDRSDARTYQKAGNGNSAERNIQYSSSIRSRI